MKNTLTLNMNPQQHHNFADICFMYMQNHTNSSTSQPKMMLKIVKTTLKTQMCPNQWRTLWVEHDIPSNNIILLTLLYVHTKSHKQFNVSTKIDVKKCNNFSYLTKCVPINKERSNIEHHIPSNTIILLTFPPFNPMLNIMTPATPHVCWRLLKYMEKLHKQPDVFTKNPIFKDVKTTFPSLFVLQFAVMCVL